MRMNYLRLGVYSGLTAVFFNAVINVNQQIPAVVCLVLFLGYIVADTATIYFSIQPSRHRFQEAIAHNLVDIIVFILCITVSIWLGNYHV